MPRKNGRTLDYIKRREWGATVNLQQTEEKKAGPGLESLKDFLHKHEMQLVNRSRLTKRHPGFHMEGKMQ